MLVAALVAMNDGWQSEPTDGPTRGWRQRLGVVLVVVVERVIKIEL